MTNPQLEARAIIRHIDALRAEFPDLTEDLQLLLDTLEGETGLFELLSKLLDAEREDAAMEAAIKSRMCDLAERRKRYQRAQEAKRALMLSLLEHAGVSKVPLPEATLSLRKNPPAPRVVDLAALPKVCTRVEVKPDMDAIKNACAAGEMPPGVVMSNGSVSLAIRSK